MTTAPRRVLAFALAAAQLLVGGAAGIAHAQDRLDAPRHVESTQSDQCITVHDATSCVLCAFAHSRAMAPGAGATALRLPAARRAAVCEVRTLRAARIARGGRARAPPTPG